MNKLQNLAQKGRHLANKAGQSLAVLGATVGTAMAAAPTGYDESAVTDAITGNLGKAIIVVGAFIVAVWTLRSMGLLKKS